MMRAVKKQSGFTLIEIIVSITLIPVLWFAIHTALSVNTMLIVQAKHRAQAAFIAQQNLDWIRTVAYADLPSITASQVVTIDNRGTTATGDDLTGFRNITLGSDQELAGGHYRQVTATVSWNEIMLGGPDKILTESLTTIISDDPIG